MKRFVAKHTSTLVAAVAFAVVAMASPWLTNSPDVPAELKK
ncbi:cyclic lactone autoinducer peptide (plasmid) [Paenibacillus rhizovicinus]|uniref:Cyclic lactone autoinducer peptide n=1 Tax=Paenibacillus rhizovicinus TaxID=2704463 RepID=A0A6C0PBL7_9BACL|nr:cyclic lactone autoinducer peptide [Paenibacillus rhizovicinus]QHW35755.1 cyclic lactone autoinducer peptide [Paenibacillus rhizovicinus]